MRYHRLAGLLSLALLAACSRQDVGPSLAPDMVSGQAGKPLADVPAWMRDASPNANLVCYLDLVEGATRGSAGWKVESGALRVLGWAVDTATRDALQAPVVVVLSDANGARVFKGARGERPDVTAAEPFKAIAPKMAGVSADIAPGALPSGTYELSFVVGTEGNAMACPLGPPNRIEVP